MPHRVGARPAPVALLLLAGGAVLVRSGRAVRAGVLAVRVGAVRVGALVGEGVPVPGVVRRVRTARSARSARAAELVRLVRAPLRAVAVRQVRRRGWLGRGVEGAAGRLRAAEESARRAGGARLVDGRLGLGVLLGTGPGDELGGVVGPAPATGAGAVARAPRPVSRTSAVARVVPGDVEETCGGTAVRVLRADEVRAAGGRCGGLRPARGGSAPGCSAGSVARPVHTAGARCPVAGTGPAAGAGVTRVKRAGTGTRRRVGGAASCTRKLAWLTTTWAGSDGTFAMLHGGSSSNPCARPPGRTVCSGLHTHLTE
ncbi:hypothetical protein BEN35_08630 [Streptomyces fradiae]|nr:hypothetical protein BEN35_08630 [Streptomyces fradiae]